MYKAFRKIVPIFIVSIMIISLFSACGTADNTPVDREEFHMGTVITERVYGKNAEKAAGEAMDKIAQLENMMTINAAGSEIDKLNDAAGTGTNVKLSDESIYVMQTAEKFAALSGGAFDITIGPLVKAWGIFTDHPRVPPQDELDRLKALVNYKDLTIDEKNHTARLARPGQIVDLGGIAKGYAGDAVIKVYKDNGIKSAYINLGGNVVALGTKPDGTLWKIGIQNPRAENGKYIGIVSVKDKALVSSGDYERYFEKDNIRYHHILDSKTGSPSQSDLIGTTIVCDKSIDGDALSTATFILGLDKGMKLVESLKGVEAVFITKDKKVYVTKGLKDSFTFDDESKEYTYVQER